MRAKTEISNDGRQLVIVKFERDGIEADTPVVQITFRVFTPNSVAVQHTRILIPLSIIRTDTHETIDLTDGEMECVLDVAAEEVNSDGEW
jgi:hypothetical protein